MCYNISSEPSGRDGSPVRQLQIITNCICDIVYIKVKNVNGRREQKRGYMLEKIYVLLKNPDKYKEQTDVFKQNMHKQDISVVCLEKNVWDKSQEQHSKQDFNIDMKDSLLITDFSVEELSFEKLTVEKSICQSLHIIGLGLDYAGNVPYIIDNPAEISAAYMRLIYSRYTQKPYTVAVTKRLVIREMCLEDLDAMYAMYDSLSECPYIEPLYERSREEEFTRNYIRDMYGFYQYGLWLAFDRESGSLAGRIGIENRMIDGELCRELGYLIDKRQQGRGFAYEASLAVLDYARREIGLKEMYICAHINNKPSICLAKKLGFELYAENIDGMNLYKKCLVP